MASEDQKAALIARAEARADELLDKDWQTLVRVQLGLAWMAGYEDGFRDAHARIGERQ